MKAGDETQVTVSMTDAVLDCRSAGRHLFARFSAHVERLADAVIAASGGRTVSLTFTEPCAGGCGVTCEVEYAVPSMELVRRTLRYPRDDEGTDIYLIPRELRGTGGRLSREEIRRALLARAVQAKRKRRRKVS